MRMKTTLELMLICGAVLAVYSQKEPTVPAASTAATPAPVQASTPPAAMTVAAAAELENVLDKRTFANVYSMCHAARVAGIPKPSDEADWRSRIAQGKGTLYKHALESFNDNREAMSACGGSTLPDDATKVAVDYMVVKSQ